MAGRDKVLGTVAATELVQPPASLGALQKAPGERHASWLELFFDLVFVAAITALAGQLHAEHSLEGLATFAGLFVPVWWAWMAYTWYAAGFGAERGASRVGLLGAMLSVAVLAAGVDGAAHGDSSTFVAAYAALLYLVAGLYALAWLRFPEARPVTVRYAIGDAIGATLWLGSLALDEGLRPLVWALAMVLLAATPVLAVLSVRWRAHDDSHIAERYGLFTLIVLGESVVAAVAGLDTGSSLEAALVAILGFIMAAAIWWQYFDRWQAMPGSGQPSGFVWAQGHYLVFAGIAAAAVGIEFSVEAAATGHALKLADTLPLGAGLGAYLLAMAVIRSATRQIDGVVVARLLAGAAIAALAISGRELGPLTVVAGATAILVAEVALELRGALPDAAEQRA
jgi:low temperature requirement protein LtrA